MKTLLLFMAALAAVAHAITLQNAEWFLDVDPGEGLGTSFTVPATEFASLDITIPATTTNALDEGVHLLGVRLQDSDGKWGHVVWRQFLNQHPHGGLVNAEWFLDADPGEGSGTPITGFSGDTASLDVTIPATTTNVLNEGAHLLGVRFQDGDGEWGQVVWSLFLNQHPHGGLAVGEYFFNTDPGHGAASPLTGVSGNVVSSEFTASLAALPAGTNLLGVRFQDGDGEWGQTIFRVFFNPEAGSRALNRVEFVVYRSSTPISSGSLLGDGSLTLNLSHKPVDVTPVPGETLLLELQVVDDSGRRSHKVFREIPVQEFTDSFLDLFFTPAEQADPLVSGGEADPDNDGLSNVLEQAMGLNPREADANGKTVGLTKSVAGLQLGFRSAAAAVFDPVTSTFDLGGLQFEIEVSTALNAWSRATSPADFTVSTSGAEQGDGSFWHVVDLVNGGQDKRFYRMKVTRP